jgi:hypothetical protein
LLPDKDPRDTKGNILSDHLIHTLIPSGIDENKYKTFLEYVLNPRVANEIIAAWRGYFRNNLPSGLTDNAIENPLLISDYLEKNIRIEDDENYCRTPLTPIGVCELKVSDSFSRDICFVAICRSLGIPSRLEPGSNVPQYYLNSAWNDIYFPDRTRSDGDKGYIRLVSEDTNPNRGCKNAERQDRYEDTW